MQNHLEISSKYHLWTRNVRNWSKSLYGKFTESIRNLPRPPRPVQEGPYGPISAHMGPNPDRSPTRTGPQPGLGPNPDWAPTRNCWGIFGILGQILGFLVKIRSESCRRLRDLQKSIVILSNGAVWTRNVTLLMKTLPP